MMFQWWSMHPFDTIWIPKVTGKGLKEMIPSLIVFFGSCCFLGHLFKVKTFFDITDLLVWKAVLLELNGFYDSWKTFFDHKKPDPPTNPLHKNHPEAFKQNRNIAPWLNVFGQAAFLLESSPQLPSTAFSPAQVLVEIQKPDMKFEYPDEEGFLYSCGFVSWIFCRFFFFSIGRDDPDGRPQCPAADVMQGVYLWPLWWTPVQWDRCLGPICHCPTNVGQVSSNKTACGFFCAIHLQRIVGLPLLIRRVTKKLMASDRNKPSGDKPSGVIFHPRKAEDMQVFSLEQIELVDIEVQ